MAATAKVSLKLLIHKESKRVLFAEADKEFVDFLFSIFTLPVGAVMRPLIEGGGMVGSLPSLYRSIENMSVNYFQPDKDKRFLLEPKLVMPGAKLPLLLPNLGSTFRQLYRCSYPGYNKNCNSYVTDDNTTICPSCGYRMDTIVTFIDPGPPRTIKASSSEEGYVKPMVTYKVMDDMEVKPPSSSTLVNLLVRFCLYMDPDIEEKVVDVGMDEGVKLLKASLQSKAVLTEVFLPKSDPTDIFMQEMVTQWLELEKEKKKRKKDWVVVKES